jgi:hypothetical protein
VVCRSGAASPGSGAGGGGDGTSGVSNASWPWSDPEAA